MEARVGATGAAGAAAGRFGFGLDFLNRFDHGSGIGSGTTSTTGSGIGSGIVPGRIQPPRFDQILFFLDRHFRQMVAQFALDQHAFLAHLDLNGRAAMRIGGFDFGRLFAGQGDLGLRLVTMRAAQ